MASTLAWPVTVVDGEYAVVEVGGRDEAVQNVTVLSQTRLGERIVVPTYGVEDPIGRAGYDPDELVDAARRWCPGVRVDADRLGAASRDLRTVVEVSRP